MKIVNKSDVLNEPHQEERRQEILAFWETGETYAELQRFSDVTLSHDRLRYDTAAYECGIPYDEIKIRSKSAVDKVFAERVVPTRKMMWKGWIEVNCKEYPVSDLYRGRTLLLLVQKLEEKEYQYSIYHGFYDFEKKCWYTDSVNGDPQLVERNDTIKVIGYKSDPEIPDGLPRCTET